MIRKIFMLAVVALLFLYTAWNFYFGAFSYDPMSEVTSRKGKLLQSVAPLSLKNRAGWTEAIYEKNIFSPNRTYREPKPVVAAPIAPVYVEPPRQPELLLKGIVLDTFGDYVAYIEIDKGKAAPMRKGDKLEGVEVLDITDRQVVLQWNDKAINLSVDKIKTILNPRLKK